VPDFDVLEPAIDPNNRISFLLDWEVTMKCNLDCSYCSSGLYGGHDNSTKHPPLDECLDSINFMYQYVDLYMRYKPAGTKYVVLNVYGGESLYHPNIEKILAECQHRYKPYQSRWHLTITTTTNAIVPEKKLLKILPYIDEFTCSYHSESSEKQKSQFKQNLLIIKQHNKRLKCVVLLHPDQTLFCDSEMMIDWLKKNSIKTLPRQLDSSPSQFNYNSQQVVWFDKFYYSDKSKISTSKVELVKVDDKFDLSDSGRACCGGRQVCKNTNQKNREFFVENKFPDWYCSVNEFFVYIKQVTKEVFVNKDCKMNFDGTVSPIGSLNNYTALLEWTETNLKNNSMPIIQCKKSRCVCGLCAPKAKNLDSFNSIMKKYRS
jgi:pyruvate-formate lyase-activating enzyme